MKLIMYLLPSLVVVVVGEWMKKTKQNIETNNIITRFKGLSITACFARCKRQPKCSAFGMNKDIVMGQTAECVLLRHHEHGKYVEPHGNGTVVELFVYGTEPDCVTSSPCEVYEVCEETPNFYPGYKCMCRKGFIGDKCHIDCRDPCCIPLISKQTEIKKNNLVATIAKLKKQYSFYIEFIVREPILTDTRYIVMHATIGGSYGVYGMRIPVIWVTYKDRSISITTKCAVNGEISYTYETPYISTLFKKWITMRVSQTKVGNKYQYKIEINGEVVHTVINTQANVFQNVKIYISNSLAIQAPGYVRNTYYTGSCGST